MHQHQHHDHHIAWLLAALAFATWLPGCGGGQDEAAPLDLGGGLSMTADGQILDSARPAAAGETR